jgi:hypothetical protein
MLTHVLEFFEIASIVVLGSFALAHLVVSLYKALFPPKK